MKNVILIIKWIAKQSKPFRIHLLLIIIFDIIAAISGVFTAIASKHLIDAAVARDKYNILFSGMYFVTFIILQIGVRALATHMSVKTNEVLSNSLRAGFFSRITRGVWLDFSKYHSGDMLTRMTSDVGVVTNGTISVLPMIISLAVQLVAAFITLIYYEPVLAAIIFVLGPLSILISRYLGRKLKKLHLKIQEAESAYRSFIQESIQNILIVKTFNLEDYSINKVGELQNEKLKWVLQKNNLSIASNSMLSLGFWASHLVAFIWGAFGLTTGSISFGTLTAFLQLVGQVQGPFMGLTQTLPQVIAAIASAERLMELENLQIEERQGALGDWNSARIRVKDVYFSYDHVNPILSNVSVDILPGEIVAVVGPSGIGKTTFIRLLLSLIRPVKGSVSFESEKGELVEASTRTRPLISYVPQGNTIFSGTIAENLRAGNPGATDKELEEAAKLACAWEFITELPEGIQTVLGEKGLGLSEGQVQRLTIARALLKKAPILILDEATSALDIVTEAKILKAIHKLGKSCTCIVITHRLSAIEICDRVLKLADGQICEEQQAAFDICKRLEA